MTDRVLSKIGDEFYDEILDGKYTRWAAELDEPTLLAALWFMGEAFGRSRANDNYSAATFSQRCDRPNGNYPAARIDSALEGLAKIEQGKRFRDEDDFLEWFRQGVFERSGVEI